MSRRRPPVALSVIFFRYKPSLWCRADVRLWHACYFSFDISPLCGVAQTPDCGIVVNYFHYKPFMWWRSDARLWHACYVLIPSRRHFRHSISLSYLYSLIFHSRLWWMTCLRASWILFCDWLSDRKLFSVHDYHLLYYTSFMMFASTFKVLPGLSLAIVLARFLAWRGATRLQPGT